MSTDIINSPLFGFALFIFLLLCVALYASAISKWLNRRRDTMFEKLAAKYGLSVTLAGQKVLKPDPPAESSDRCEMRKISGTVHGKSIIVQDIQDYPANPSDNAMAKLATPDRVSVSRNNASHPNTRFFLEEKLVSSSDVWASERKIATFLDSVGT